MLTRILTLTSALLIASCAYIADDRETQKLTIVTPGANNAKCLVSAGGSVKYTYWPPETTMIGKSDGDLVIECDAPGNRSKTVVISPDISKVTTANLVNGVVPGLAWDYTSKSMYNYPEYVEVDFTHMEPKAYPLPAQNQPDIKQPEEYDLEEFSPGVPRLNEDRYAPAIEIRERQPFSEFNLFTADVPVEDNTSAGNLVVIEDSPTRDLNEAGQSGSMDQVLGKLNISQTTTKTTIQANPSSAPASTTSGTRPAGAPVNLLPGDDDSLSNITFE